jgi:hypothetical protein
MSSPASYSEQNWLLVRAGAIILGVIGMLLAVSRIVRDGIISVISIFAGLVGAIAAVFKRFF